MREPTRGNARGGWWGREGGRCIACSLPPPQSLPTPPSSPPPSLTHALPLNPPSSPGVLAHTVQPCLAPTRDTPPSLSLSSVSSLPPAAPTCTPPATTHLPNHHPPASNLAANARALLCLATSTQCGAVSACHCSSPQLPWLLPPSNSWLQGFRAVQEERRVQKQEREGNRS